MSLIPDRPDLTVESQCGLTDDGKHEVHKFPAPDGDIAPVGTLCTCGKTVVTHAGNPPAVQRLDQR
jgi:hypothetical protein